MNRLARFALCVTVLTTGACSGDAVSTTAASASSTTPAVSSTTTGVTSVPPTTAGPVGLPIASDNAPPFEVLFSLPVGDGGVTYAGDATVTDFPVTGPLGLAVAGDGTIWITDTEARRIIRLSATGDLLLAIDTDVDGVGAIIDVAAYQAGVLGLEVVPAMDRYRIVHYSATGEFLGAGILPDGHHLDDGLTGIEVGPAGEVWIELEVGFRVSEVTLVEGDLTPTPGDAYRSGPLVLRSLPSEGGFARFGIGDLEVAYPLTEFGSLTYEGLIPGAVAVLLADVSLDDVVVVDDTVVFLDFEGVAIAEADYPLAELAYVPQDMIAVAPDGRLIALLPRSDRLDVVSLTLYPPGHFTTHG